MGAAWEGNHCTPSRFQHKAEQGVQYTGCTDPLCSSLVTQALNTLIETIHTSEKGTAHTCTYMCTHTHTHACIHGLCSASFSPPHSPKRLAVPNEEATLCARCTLAHLHAHPRHALAHIQTCRCARSDSHPSTHAQPTLTEDSLSRTRKSPCTPLALSAHSAWWRVTFPQ